MNDILSRIDFILQEKKLSTKMRKRLANKSFVFPDGRKYPIHDRKHGANALARVTQFGTEEEKKKVRKNVCDKYPSLPYCQKQREKSK